MAGRVVNAAAAIGSAAHASARQSRVRRLRRGIGQQPVAAVKLLFFRIGNVQRDPLPGIGMLSGLVLRM
jgi:hypothetical protein